MMKHCRPLIPFGFDSLRHTLLNQVPCLTAAAAVSETSNVGLSNPNPPARASRSRLLLRLLSPCTSLPRTDPGPVSACAPSLAQKIDDVARVLARHPGLRVRVEGFARPGAPSLFGNALSQARAAQVRKALLQQLNALSDAWADEPESCGEVRDGGYSEEEGMDSSLTFYRPRRLGARLQAEGCWKEVGMQVPREARNGQCARIRVVGFDEQMKEQ